jgi:TRAP-type C4-dicarboxylate transport system substrate-binding protein
MKGYYDKLSKEHGLRLISYSWLHGYRHMLSNKPVKVPADAAGQRIRTIGAPIWVKTIESMGAIPTAMAWTEVYNGMQQKAIDGCEAQHLASYTSRLYEVIKYIDKTGHIMILNNWLVGGRGLFGSGQADKRNN